MQLTLIRPLLLLAAMLVPGAWQAAAGAELLMLEKPGCPWCARFDTEIAPAWPKTAEGQRAPLRRVDITRPWPEDLGYVQKEIFTPTFVLVHEGREYGRLRGYVGEEFFWYLAGDLLARLPDGPDSDPQPPADDGGQDAAVIVPD